MWHRCMREREKGLQTQPTNLSSQRKLVSNPGTGGNPCSEIEKFISIVPVDGVVENCRDGEWGGA
ncbi:MAG: hypothetical protein BWY17_02400 [Deltaproteobacteria bacterium ADurb.Bin207]|jgi:hypothetical protein|nr:MAG: hypothetical protein BWY17_02400 [Deltaproteobacteria bacterium ADurb.Bin207]